MRLEKSSPLFPAPYTIDEVAAIQALERGEATPSQQKTALNWIVHTLCGNYDLSYRPGEDGRRDTDFAEGKRFVSLTLVKMIRLNILKMKESEDGGRNSKS